MPKSERRIHILSPAVGALSKELKMKKLERVVEPGANAALFAQAMPEHIGGMVTLALQFATLPPELTANSELMQRARLLDEERLLEWMQREPRGQYVVVHKSDGNVVGLCWMLSIKPALLVPFLRGELRRGFRGDDLEPFQPGRPATCIVQGIACDKSGGRRLQTYYSSILLRGWRADLERLGREGVSIPALYSYNLTDEGRQLAVRGQMQEWEPSSDGKRCTFWLDVASSTSFLFQRYKRGFEEWQREHPEMAVTHS